MPKKNKNDESLVPAKKVNLEGLVDNIMSENEEAIKLEKEAKLSTAALVHMVKHIKSFWSVDGESTEYRPQVLIFHCPSSSTYLKITYNVKRTTATLKVKSKHKKASISNLLDSSVFDVFNLPEGADINSLILIISNGTLVDTHKKVNLVEVLAYFLTVEVTTQAELRRHSIELAKQEAERRKLKNLDSLGL